MNQLNSIILEGNLVRDPEGKLTPKGTALCEFSVASNRFYKQDGVRHSEVSYFDVEVWSKVAESCEKHLNKGRGVRVVGRLKQNRWTDEQGLSHSRIKVVGEHVEFKPLYTGSAGSEINEDGDAIDAEEPLAESRESNQEELVI
ncbi:MAG: single-stranded DNA-binding protein [Spirochaetaceae bacterium 4572_59]|nr:MAG: single-stranded DNA-binding protein [Spirochaetaceae bacterium 4572_59]